MFKTIDPKNSPDGLCWTVVHTRDGKIVCRERFVEEKDARLYADRVARMTDCLIHIEGPAVTNGERS